MGETLHPWRVRTATIATALCLGLWPVSGHAGGLGNAMLLALVGIAGAVILPPRSWRAGLDWRLVVLVFLVWAGLTAIWSPYPVSWPIANPVQVGVGYIAFLAGAAVLCLAFTRHPKVFTRLLVAGLMLTSGFAIADAVSGYSISLGIDPPSGSQTRGERIKDTEMNIGHGLTAAALLLPVAIAVRPKLSVPLAGAFVIAAIVMSLFVGILAITTASVLMVVAKRSPRTGILAGFGFAAATIFLAPALALVSQLATPDQRAALPFSWQHRAEGWAYLWTRLDEAPLVGHGFDATRSFAETSVLRGYDMALVSLHPHNAGLHIWVETGAVGAGLAVIALALMSAAALRWASTPARACAVAGLVGAVAAISAVSYGVWQEWWWASIILAASTLALIRGPARA